MKTQLFASLAGLLSPIPNLAAEGDKSADIVLLRFPNIEVRSLKAVHGGLIGKHVITD